MFGEWCALLDSRRPPRWLARMSGAGSARLRAREGRTPWCSWGAAANKSAHNPLRSGAVSDVCRSAGPATHTHPGSGGWVRFVPLSRRGGAWRRALRVSGPAGPARPGARAGSGTECCPQSQISDRFGCTTTHSRVQKNRFGRFTAGGWGNDPNAGNGACVGTFPSLTSGSQSSGGQRNTRICRFGRSVFMLMCGSLSLISGRRGRPAVRAWCVPARQARRGDRQPQLIQPRRKHESRTGRHLLPGGRALPAPRPPGHPARRAAAVK